MRNYPTMALLIALCLPVSAQDAPDLECRQSDDPREALYEQVLEQLLDRDKLLTEMITDIGTSDVSSEHLKISIVWEMNAYITQLEQIIGQRSANLSP